MKKILPYFILHVILFVYSFGGFFSKTAATKPFLSFEWILLYGVLILILGFYAIFWQQVLKMIPLNIAYVNKSVTLIWSMLFGALFFEEKITLFNILGAFIVLVGVMLIAVGNNTESKQKESAAPFNGNYEEGDADNE